MDVSDNIAYFGNGGYLEIVDISDPANPVELGKIVTPLFIRCVAVSSNYAYVVDGYDGLYIIRNDLSVGIEETDNRRPEQFKLLQNYPNPFNPITVILYQLSQSSFVTLEVYNIVGQLIETLVNERRNAGYYTVHWDTSKVVSGLYLFRIKAGDPSSGSPKGQAGQVFTEVKKCVLIK